jgi:hypothetical protein
MQVEFSVRDLVQWIVSEGALVAFLYYVLMLLKVEGNLWVHSALLAVLLTLAAFFCPLMKCSR